MEINLILEKLGCKRDILVACDTGYVKIVFPLLTKVITLHI